MSARTEGGACGAFLREALRGLLSVAALASMLGATLASCAAASPASPSDSRVAAPQTGAPQAVLELANSIRSRGCNAHRRSAPPLHPQSRLDAAAERLANGASLDTAIASVGYRAMRSFSLEVTGEVSRAGLRHLLASRCAQLMDPALRDIGIYRAAHRLWVLIAAPLVTPELSDPQRVADEVNDLVNRARASGHRCGNRLFRPVPPLHPSVKLREAALAHSRDMAAHSYLEHIGRNGSTPGKRVARTGYLWAAVGENIAGGAPSARDVVAGWLASPEHCANIMDPDFSETAVAYAIDARSRMGVYWTEEFAAPQPSPSRRGTSPKSRHFGR